MFFMRGAFSRRLALLMFMHASVWAFCQKRSAVRFMVTSSRVEACKMYSLSQERRAGSAFEHFESLREIFLSYIIFCFRKKTRAEYIKELKRLSHC